MQKQNSMSSSRKHVESLRKKAKLLQTSNTVIITSRLFDVDYLG